MSGHSKSLITRKWHGVGDGHPRDAETDHTLATNARPRLLPPRHGGDPHFLGR